MRLKPPARHELEVSLFGPGYGECVVVHLGANEWLIVDSCLDQRSRRQPALAYLESIGVDAGSAVVVVLATHWHNDHVRGIGEIVRACVDAEFWMSEALRSDELLLATRRFGSDQASKHNPFREFHSVIETLRNRDEGGSAAPVPGYAGARRLLWRRGSNSRTPGCEVMALSPSRASAQASREVLAAQLPSALTDVPYDVDEPEPNEAAVAVWIQVGKARVLLGSDLENRDLLDRGWNAVLSDPMTPMDPATVVKVPHHGSDNADHEAMWTRLLVGAPWAIMTPFRRGPTPLPRPTDLLRIQTRTDRIYLTAGAHKLKPAPKPRRLRLAMMQSAIRIEDEEGMAGHIRLRVNARTGTVSDWEVELDGPARHAPRPRARAAR